MGTNFYCRKHISKKNRKEIVEQLNNLIKEVKDESNDANIEDLFAAYRENVDTLIPEQIHLGKRSYGWQFLWNYHNGRYFMPNLESIKSFLKDKIIYDEYGKVFSSDAFLNDELVNCLYNKDAKLDDGISGEYSKYYFLSDGLRFAKFEDFS